MTTAPARADASMPDVLLVEDEPNIREAMRFILARDGWRVAVHGDGATAAGRIASAAPAVVVLDVMLPGLSGLDVLRQVRAREVATGAAPVPILMLTARGQARDRDLALALGASAFMTKPFANDALLARLRAMLAPALPGAAGTG